MVAVQKLTIRIGGNMLKDLKEVWKNPAKAKPGAHTLYLKSAEELCKVLSPKKLELLIQLIEDQPKKKALGELAAGLKRKQEAVSRDASQLEALGLVKKNKEKQKVFLKPQCNSIEIQLANA